MRSTEYKNAMTRPTRQREREREDEGEDAEQGEKTACPECSRWRVGRVIAFLYSVERIT